MVARDELVAAVTDRYARRDRGERGRILASLRRYRGLLGYTTEVDPVCETVGAAS